MSLDPSSVEDQIHSLKIVILVLLATLCGGAGYFYGKGQKALTNRLPAQEAATEDHQVNVSSASLTRAGGPADLVFEPEYAQLLKKNRLEIKAEKMARAFTSAELGQSMSQILTLLDFKPLVDSPEGKRVSDQIRLAEAQPTQALEEIKGALNLIDAEYNNERHFLIQFVEKLDLDSADRIEFLTKEVELNLEHGERKPYRVNALVAFATLMKMDLDMTTLESILKQAFSLTDLSYGDRLAMMSLFYAKYPDQVSRVDAELGPLVL